ncbi:MAG: hypothetical protein K6G23_05550 [Lachnospiraceae bacterium]|nr:hypothetical protein [Lachnospiraceae bacterium]
MLDYSFIFTDVFSWDNSSKPVFDIKRYYADNRKEIDEDTSPLLEDVEIRALYEALDPRFQTAEFVSGAQLQDDGHSIMLQVAVFDEDIDDLLVAGMPAILDLDAFPDVEELNEIIPEYLFRILATVYAAATACGNQLLCRRIESISKDDISALLEDCDEDLSEILYADQDLIPATDITTTTYRYGRYYSFDVIKDEVRGRYLAYLYQNGSEHKTLLVTAPLSIDEYLFLGLVTSMAEEGIHDYAKELAEEDEDAYDDFEDDYDDEEDEDFDEDYDEDEDEDFDEDDEDADDDTDE